MDESKSGIIYILTNVAMPGYIKIGFTTDLSTRLKSLDRTGVPLPFEVYYAAKVEDMQREEGWLHQVFGDRRVRDNREFFKINPEYAALALKRVSQGEQEVPTNATPSELEEIEEEKARRSRFHFANYQIPLGSKLVFTRNPEVIVTVVENDKIALDGVVDSLSSTAQRLLGYKHRPQGTQYFLYNGEILDDLRRRVDGGN